MSNGERATAQSLAMIMAMFNGDIQGACTLVEGMPRQDLQRTVLFLARFAAVVAARDDEARGQASLPHWQSTALRLSAHPI